MQCHESRFEPATSLTFSDDARTLVVGTPYVTIIWDLTRRVKITSFEDSEGKFGAWAVSPNGSLVATEHTWGGPVVVRDARTGAELWRHSEFEKFVSASTAGAGRLLFSTDGQVLRHVRQYPSHVWEARTGVERRGGWPRYVRASSRDGTTIADVETRTVTVLRDGHRRAIPSSDVLGLSPSGRFAVTYDYRTVSVVAVESADSITHVPATFNWSFSSDERIFVAVNDGLLTFIELASGKQTGVPLPLASSVTVVGFSPDLSQIAAGYRDGSVRVWSLRD